MNWRSTRHDWPLILMVTNNLTNLCYFFYRQLLFKTNDYLQVLDQAIQLVYLDKFLDDKAWVDKSDGLNILLNGFLISLLSKKFVSVLFYNFTDNFTRKLSIYGNSSCQIVLILLHKVVDLLILWHRT